ncbi:hypothetical protein LCGC14_1822130 [marine sediment metagenome]|uniref:Ada DNA repair metal-binding domain-containing protein n=1 Tax=marine sediment metagenome TaxID=412755 RepID=A0A0F9GIK6_9ZZZZ
MAEHKRGLEGSVSSGKTTKGGSGVGADNRKTAKFWLSHRQGPFMFHDNTKDCEQQPRDNVSYLNDAAAAIEQGFMPCPRCMTGG